MNEPTYEIRRFYRDPDRSYDVIVRGLTLEQAQAHCQRDDTHGDGWFDGYEAEEVYPAGDWPLVAIDDHEPLTMKIDDAEQADAELSLDELEAERHLAPGKWGND